MRKRMENNKWSKRVIHTDIGEEEMQADQKESGLIASKKCNMPQRSQTLHN